MKKNQEQRRMTASNRLEERAKRTPSQQLSILDSRFGKGEGAQKERLRLLALLEKKVEEAQPAKPKKRGRPKKTLTQPVDEIQ